MTITVLLAAAFIFAAALLFAPQTASAADGATQYIMQNPSDGELLANASPSVSEIEVFDISKKIIFRIPKSYYLKITGDAFGDYYIVNIPFIDTDFYVDNSNVQNMLHTGVSFASEGTAYPSASELNINLKDGVSVMLTDGTTVTSSRENGQNGGYTIKYLGEYPQSVGETATENRILAAFKKGGEEKFGYISKSDVLDYKLPYQANAEARRNQLIAEQNKPDTGITDGGNIVPNTSKTLRIILIVGITVPAVLIVILLFKPSKRADNYDKRAMKKRRSPDEFDYDRSRSYNRDYDRGYDRNRDYDRDRDYNRGGDYDRDRSYDRGRDYDRPRNYDDRDYR